VDGAWAARRREAAAAKAQAMDQAAAAEHAQAHTLLVEFVAALQAAGVPPEPLQAVAYDGHTRVRTDVTGWYLRANRSVGVDADANYYVLQVPGGPFARWRRAALSPSPPPMVVGKGGRDGESVDLPELLATRLEELAP
jgi:hypothetical protein